MMSWITHNGLRWVTWKIDKKVISVNIKAFLNAGNTSETKEKVY